MLLKKVPSVLVLMAFIMWLLSASVWAADDLPPCNSMVADTAQKCGTATPCPTTTNNATCTGSITVEKQGNWTPCKGGGSSQYCKDVPNFICTKSWYCVLNIVTPDPTTPFIFYWECQQGTTFPTGSNGQQIVSRTNNGANDSCVETE